MKHAQIASEEEYFLKHEMELKRKAQEEHKKKLKTEEQKRLKELHYMHCPKCGMDLTEIEFRGIRVDRCFSCEGTWFDAGEVEAAIKLEKSALDSIFTLFKKGKKG
jgi:hypothetical protein